MFKSKFFIPSAIFLTTTVLAFTGFFSISFIQGINHKNSTEIKSASISVTPTLTPIPTPIIGIKKEAEVSTTHIPTTTPTAMPTIQKPDNTAKLQTIGNMFKQIGELNNQITIYQLLDNNSQNNTQCDPNKWSQQYLPNGDSNPNYVFNPYDQNSLYQQCLSSLASTSHGSQINSLKSQITNLNNQIQSIIATCLGSECNDYYWQLANAFEAQGYIIK